MSTELTLRIGSGDFAATELIGERLGRNLRGGEVIELRSDLGGGKTTLVRGIARGAQSMAQVSSPSFMIEKQYKAGKLTIHHFDLYRLPEAGMVGEMLQDAITDVQSVTIIEWGVIAEHVLPKERLTVRLTKTDETSRQIEITYPESYQYLVAELLQDSRSSSGGML